MSRRDPGVLVDNEQYRTGRAVRARRLVAPLLRLWHAVRGQNRWSAEDNADVWQEIQWYRRLT